MIDTAMIKEIIKIGIDQAVEIDEYCSVEEYSIDRIIEIGLGIIRTIGIILRENFGVNLRSNQNYRGQN